MSHAKHLLRVTLLLLVGFIFFELGRRLIVPASFGKYGHYRANNLKEQMNMPVKWEASRTKECEVCHEKRVAEHKNSKHENVPCMDCHGPISEHVTKTPNGEMKKTNKMPKEGSYKHCVRCHQKLAARAPGIRQIDVLKHLREKGMQMEKDVCLGCHDPHNIPKRL
jgi:hypothetical protein